MVARYYVVVKNQRGNGKLTILAVFGIKDGEYAACSLLRHLLFLVLQT
jgi:hypothetical protein